jgi:hypothetical protein
MQIWLSPVDHGLRCEREGPEKIYEINVMCT